MSICAEKEALRDAYSLALNTYQAIAAKLAELTAESSIREYTLVTRSFQVASRELDARQKAYQRHLKIHRC